MNLASLPVNLLKSSIRVTFINEYVSGIIIQIYNLIIHSTCFFCFVKGLKEAGIDQDGVFKEFLQETISELVNPKFQLFQVE